jgi:hypothetical protein
VQFKTSLVSGPDVHFHFSTASTQAFVNKGCPPITFVDVALPFGATTTNNLAVPSKRIERAGAG